jgi:Cu+-exporting ATPase
MQVNEKQAAGTSIYLGKTYYFCSGGCKASFDRDPEKYSKGSSKSEDHASHHGGH